MKFNFKKISAIATSALLTGMTVGVAAAASFPAPFSDGDSTQTAIVYGAATTADTAAAGDINSYLKTKVKTTSSGGAPTGGDSLLLAKNKDKLNIGDTWGVYTGTIDDDDLANLLAEGTYRADDNDEFDFEQKITLGTPGFTHFRDSDYEGLIGLDTKTPVLGFKIGSSTHIMNYTLDFTQDAESDVVSGDLDDLEGSDLILMGKKYYVSDWKNGTVAANSGKLTLLDSANIGTVAEGETVTVTSGGTPYEVSINYIDGDEVSFIVNGVNAPSSGKLNKGNSYKLDDGAYIGVRDISRLEVSGESGTATFSIGSGKLELTNAADIKLNDKTIQGVKAYLTKGTASSGVEKIDKIVIEWTSDEEVFLSPEAELVMPGFEAIKFTMNDLVRPEEEMLSLENDGDTSVELTVPIKDGTVSFNLLYANASGEFIGLGKAADERLATTNGTGSNAQLIYQEKNAGSDYHEYFVASYESTTEGESYLLRAKVMEDTDAGRNETTIEKKTSDGWVEACKEKAAGDTCDIGDVSLTIGTIAYTSGGGENVTITGGSGVSFNELFTAGGLKIFLPYNVTLAGGTQGFTAGEIDYGSLNSNHTGHSADSFHLTVVGEDKDSNIASGTAFNITINENTDNNLHITQVDGSGTGGANGLEVGSSSSVYEAYIVGANNETAPRVLHYTKPDEDYLEVYYPSGDDSETYAEVYLAEGAVSLGDPSQAGDMIFKDNEEGWKTKDVIIVGGSCINEAAATALGVAMGTCAEAFTAATNVGSGQYLIQSVDGAFTTGKIALVVAGYEAADTAAAATRLTTQPDSIDTAAGNKYVYAVGADLESTKLSGP